MNAKEIIDLENEVINNKTPAFLKNLRTKELPDDARDQFDDHVDKGLSLGYSLKDTIAAILYEDECGSR